MEKLNPEFSEKNQNQTKTGREENFDENNGREENFDDRNDDDLILSQEAMNALKEFYDEQNLAQFNHQNLAQFNQPKGDLLEENWVKNK